MWAMVIPSNFHTFPCIFLQEAAEKWIANLILNAHLNAKIDSQSGTVVMGSQTQGVHEQIMDKAKQLSVRAFSLANTVVGSGRV